MRRHLRARRGRIHGPGRGRRTCGDARTDLIRGLGAPAGQLLAGTSGFAYPDWAPRFYPAGLPDAGRLAYYASRLDAVELNNTFYQRPTTERIAAWCAAVPAGFRFVVKAQRGASLRALGADAAESVAWLTERLDGFEDRLGAVLYRVPENAHRHDDGTSDQALARLLAAWPRRLPLVMEFQHRSWHVDETFRSLRDAGAVLSTTELPEATVAPDIRVTGTGLYLRLRRHDYDQPEIDAWARRLRPFLEVGHPVLAFFRHDETGRATELVAALREAVARG
ncbi:MAG: DUF72 domain-containing protein [Chloroflexi bacterium]|nr:DUF72 domain-containing protein [Chloroflexota bacterium]